MSQSPQIKENDLAESISQFSHNPEGDEGSKLPSDWPEKAATGPRKTSLATNAVKGAAAFSKSIAILQMIADSEQPPSISPK